MNDSHEYSSCDTTQEELTKAISQLAESLFEDSMKSNTSFVTEMRAKFPEEMNIESIHAIVGYSLDQALTAMVIDRFPEAKNNRRLLNALMAWEKIYRITGNLVEFVHGTMVCCMDRGRWIANAYIQFVRTGDPPDMTIDEKCFWKPEFGSAMEWMTLCESIVQMQCGRSQDFVAIYSKLALNKK